jgi:hypothetical protein
LFQYALFCSDDFPDRETLSFSEFVQRLRDQLFDVFGQPFATVFAKSFAGSD